MSRMYRFLGLVALMGALAQTPAPTDFVLRFDVDLVQVDAIVTDSRGNHIGGLKPENFEVYQDGKPQKIIHFSYIAGKTPSRPPNGSPEAPVLSPRAATRSAVRRTIVFMLDDARMEFGDFEFARKALRGYIETQLQPDDMAAIFRTSYGSGAMQTFTNNARWLESTLTRINWRPPLTTMFPAPVLTNPSTVRARSRVKPDWSAGAKMPWELSQGDGGWVAPVCSGAPIVSKVTHVHSSNHP